MRGFQSTAVDLAEKTSSYEIASEHSFQLSLLGGALKREEAPENPWSSENEVTLLLTFRGIVPPVVRSALEMCINSDACRSAKIFLYSNNHTEPQLPQISVRSEFKYAPAPDRWGINE